jgi:hypothetical protein
MYYDYDLLFLLLHSRTLNDKLQTQYIEEGNSTMIYEVIFVLMNQESFF